MDMKRKPVFECPVNATLHVIGGRWKILVIYHLAGGIARFNELQRAVHGISKRVLAQQLRQLERLARSDGEATIELAGLTASHRYAERALMAAAILEGRDHGRLGDVSQFPIRAALTHG